MIKTQSTGLLTTGLRALGLIALISISSTFNICAWDEYYIYQEENIPAFIEYSIAPLIHPYSFDHVGRNNIIERVNHIIERVQKDKNLLVWWRWHRFYTERVYQVVLEEMVLFVKKSAYDYAFSLLKNQSLMSTEEASKKANIITEEFEQRAIELITGKNYNNQPLPGSFHAIVGTNLYNAINKKIQIAQAVRTENSITWHTQTNYDPQARALDRAYQDGVQDGRRY